MIVIRRILTPLGGATALFLCWLPWVRLECGTTRVDPNLWQLAEQEASLYIFPLAAVLILGLGLLYLILRRRVWGAATLVPAIAGTVAWIVVLLKKQELAEKQVTAEGLGGKLGSWAQQIQIEPSAAYYGYLAAMVLTIVLAIWCGVSNGDRPPPAERDV